MRTATSAPATQMLALWRASVRILLLLALSACARAAFAQDIDSAVSNVVPLWQPGHSITTSIKDALPVATTVRGYDEEFVQPIPPDWKFGPGYYRSVVRSYCLHAGSYGPTKGDGYLIAPLKGDRAPLIRSIILRSQEHPEVAQEDVQRLIWGTEDGAQWDSYDAAFKARVAPLLTPEEIVALNVEPKRAEVAGTIRRTLGGLIPGAARNAVDTYAEMRSKITSVTNYQDLENLAVKSGVAPWGKDSRKDVQPGPWAYVGDGFYIRAFPESYPTTTLEIFRSVPGTWTRDDKGRITRFDSGGHSIDATYQDEPSMETVDGKSVKVWRFKAITFHHPDGRTYVIENRGYVVARAAPEQHYVPGGGVESASPLWRDGGLDDMGFFHDGLKAATNPGDLKGKGKWIADNVERTGSAWNAASNALAGVSTSDASPRKFDPTHHVAAPANTAKQRLAISAFVKG